MTAATTPQPTTGPAPLRSKRTLSIVLALLLYALGGLVPEFGGLTRPMLQVLGIFAGTLLLWLTVAIDWPSLLCLAALANVRGMKIGALLQASLGGTTFAFLIFTFICTYALAKTSFVRRCALAFLDNRFSRRGPSAFVLAYLSSVLVLGLFMSPTVLFVVYLPIHKELCEMLGLTQGERPGSLLMLGLALVCALSSGMTPIAHVFSVMAMGFYETASGQAISYGTYMAFAVPVGLLLFGVLWLLLRYLLRPDMDAFRPQNPDGTTRLHFGHLRSELPPWGRKDRKILFIFALVVLGWLAPTLLGTLLPGLAKGLNALSTAYPPLIGAILLFVLTEDGHPLLDFHEALTKGVGWGSVLMAASTLALGAAMTSEAVGLSGWLGSHLSGSMAALPPALLVLGFTLWAALQTNLSSNMVTVTVVSAATLPLCLAPGSGVSAAAMACIIGFMGSLSFATPPAHPNIALAIASGWVTGKRMLLYGSLLMLAAVALAAGLGYPLLQRLL